MALESSCFLECMCIWSMLPCVLRISGWRRHFLRWCHSDLGSKQSSLTHTSPKSTPLLLVSGHLVLEEPVCWMALIRVKVLLAGHFIVICEHPWWGGIMKDQASLKNWFTALVLTLVNWLQTSEEKFIDSPPMESQAGALRTRKPQVVVSPVCGQIRRLLKRKHCLYPSL